MSSSEIFMNFVCTRLTFSFEDFEEWFSENFYKHSLLMLSTYWLNILSSKLKVNGIEIDWLRIFSTINHLSINKWQSIKNSIYDRSNANTSLPCQPFLFIVFNFLASQRKHGSMKIVTNFFLLHIFPWKPQVCM